MDGSSLVFEQCARVLPPNTAPGAGWSRSRLCFEASSASPGTWIPPRMGPQPRAGCLILIFKESWDIPQRKQHRVSLFAGCFPAGGISPVGAIEQILIQLYFSCRALLLSLGLQSCLQALQVAVKMDLLVLRLSVRSQLRATLKARARTARCFFKR